MKIIEVQFAPWDQSYYFKPEDASDNGIEVKTGQKVVVQTAIGIDIGKVVALGELNQPADKNQEVKPIERIATSEDELKSLTLNKGKNKLIAECKKMIKKYQLEMKLVDVHISFDDLRMTFAFIADGRVDFRELVKELTRKYQRSVRLQQIGVRDEARVFGDTGACGRGLCCKSFLGDLGNVSTDHAREQQVAHRGAERLSGPCDRLKCCLRFEEAMYHELAKNFPAVGQKIKTKSGEGVVTDWHVLKGTVSVNIGTDRERSIIEVEIKK